MALQYLFGFMRNGMRFMVQSFGLSLAVFAVVICIKELAGKSKAEGEKFSLDPVQWYLWILSFVFIALVTGIVGGTYGVTSPFDGTCNISIRLIDEISWAGILNIVLFVPYGFFTTLVFPRFRGHLGFTALAGFGFSWTIEVLQMFLGRFSQVEDLLMNTSGMVIGYLVCMAVAKTWEAKKEVLERDLEMKLLGHIYAVH